MYKPSTLEAPEVAIVLDDAGPSAESVAVGAFSDILSQKSNLGMKKLGSSSTDQAYNLLKKTGLE